MRTFIYGMHRYEYRLEYGQRKTLSLIVEPNMAIRLQAPVGTPDEKIEQFLVKKWSWLNKQLTELNNYQATRLAKEYISGESYYYLGRQYMLEVSAAKQDSVTIRPGRLSVSTTQNVRNGAYTKLLVQQWYRHRQRLIFRQQYSKALKLFTLDDKPHLEIRPMTRRWGSYTKTGTIVLNPRLIEAPSEAIHYVLVHELCHIIGPRHNEIFYRELDKRLPNWKQIKRNLEVKYG